MSSYLRRAMGPDQPPTTLANMKQEREHGDKPVVLPARAPMACEFTKSHTAGGPGQLDHWERIELKRILETNGGGVCMVPVGWAGCRW